MSLKDQITEDMKAAMRAKDADAPVDHPHAARRVQAKEVDERITLDDAAVIGIVDKLIKQRKDSVAAFRQAGRTDLVDKETAEIEVLEGLPAAAPCRRADRMPRWRHRRPARRLGPRRHGQVMGAAKTRLAGKADMAQVSAAVKAGAGEVSCIMSNVLSVGRVAPDVCVAPQLTPESMAEAARAGFRSVVNNRPDFEGGPHQPTNAAIEAAASAAGLEYRFLPVQSAYQSPEEIAAFAQLLDELPRPMLVFCRSGARTQAFVRRPRASS